MVGLDSGGGNFLKKMQWEFWRKMQFFNKYFWRNSSSCMHDPIPTLPWDCSWIALFWNTLQKLQIEKHIKKAALNKCDQCNYPRIDPSRLMQDKKSPLNDNTENADNSDETLVFYNSWIIREAIGLKNICTSGHWSGAYYASHVFPFVWGGCFLPYCWRNAVQCRFESKGTAKHWLG